MIVVRGGAGIGKSALLDRAGTLPGRPRDALRVAFVARRLAAERLALLVTPRDSLEGDADSFGGLPALRLDGLSETDPRARLDFAIQAPLGDVVRDRIVAEAQGKQLALLELPLGVGPGGLVGGFEPPGAKSILSRIENSFGSRSSSLSKDAQTLLLVAAAEPTRDTTLLWWAVAESMPRWLRLRTPRRSLHFHWASAILSVVTTHFRRGGVRLI